MIYETLQGSTQTINTNVSKSPKSLSEAIVRNSLSIPERLQENSLNSPAMERMKVLAGIKK